MKHAFTLVEIMVALTIVSILSTLGFVAYIEYLSSVRDSSRLQQVSSLYSALELYGTKNRIPMGQDMLHIHYDGTPIGQQGDLDQSVLDKIRYSDGGKDPKTKNFFTYFVSPDKKQAQILYYLEQNTSSRSFDIPHTNNTYDESIYTPLYPQVHGTNLGVLIEDGSNTPLNKLFSSGGSFDISTATGTYISYINNDDVIVGQQHDFAGLVPNTNCKKISQMLGSISSGVYKINPTGNGPVTVYCEMDDSGKGYGGGWLLVARTHEDSTDISNFGWLYSVGSVFDDSEAYSLGSSISGVRFSEIMLATYDTGKNITAGLVWEVEPLFFPSEIVIPDEQLSNQYSERISCNMVYDSVGFDNSCHPMKYWGAFGNREQYVFNRKRNSEEGFILPYMFESSNNSLPKDKDTGGNSTVNNLRGEQGMIFVR